MLPRFNYLVPFLRCVTPVCVFDAVSEWFGASDAMSDFKGRAAAAKKTN